MKLAAVREWIAQEKMLYSIRGFKVGKNCESILSAIEPDLLKPDIWEAIKPHAIGIMSSDDIVEIESKVYEG